MGGQKEVRVCVGAPAHLCACTCAIPLGLGWRRGGKGKSECVGVCAWEHPLLVLLSNKLWGSFPRPLSVVLSFVLGKSDMRAACIFAT